jgi:hypothetical protein
MDANPIAWYVDLEVIIFLGGLAVIIAYRLLTGGINTRYLLYIKRRDGAKYLSPERLQLLIFTMGTAAFYLLHVVNSLKMATPSSPAVLPDVSKETLALLGGSHGIYLGGKAYTMLFKKLTKGE